MFGKTQFQYQFQSIKFALAACTNESLALTNGRLIVAGTEARFGLALAPKADGQWELKDVRCDEVLSKFLHNTEVLQQLVNKAAVLLKTINMWPEEPGSSNGARLSMNRQLAPSAVADRVIISFRPDMLSLPMAEWDTVWHLIGMRIKSDPYFRVQGFSKDEVEQAITPLKNIFSGPWVGGRYRQKHIKPKMASTIPQDMEGWFPAYHLARTALGAICIDPGWNYLIEIGLSIRELAKFNGLQRLTQQIARSPGTQHHLCLAAELFRRGYLLALEPKTGSGRSTNDLLVTCGDRQYEIEVKEFASSEPARQLIKEIERKCKNLPERPERPVVFHAVLIDKGNFEKSKEDLFFEAVKELAPNIPSKISAVVAGRRFVDSSGGRVKRDAEIQILNPVAQVPSNAEDLATLFARNYHSVHYPIFGIGSFFHFSS